MGLKWLKIFKQQKKKQITISRLLFRNIIKEALFEYIGTYNGETFSGY